MCIREQYRMCGYMDMLTSKLLYWPEPVADTKGVKLFLC